MGDEPVIYWRRAWLRLTEVRATYSPSKTEEDVANRHGDGGGGGGGGGGGKGEGGEGLRTMIEGDELVIHLSCVSAVTRHISQTTQCPPSGQGESNNCPLLDLIVSYHSSQTLKQTTA